MGTCPCSSVDIENQELFLEGQNDEETTSRNNNTEMEMTEIDIDTTLEHLIKNWNQNCDGTILWFNIY